MRTWIVTLWDAHTDSKRKIEIETLVSWDKNRFCEEIDKGWLNHHLGMWEEVSDLKIKNGGKRAGAGRKIGKEKPQTKAVRLPISLIDRIQYLEDLDNLLEDWKERMESASGSDTSPRWEKFREFLDEIDSL